ncbi:MAG: hypothetical protein N3C12_09845 [Candidatus Binatia bacterium]|nr:hypothetical protein [Candidatus Binatia bacterium]
MDLYPTIVAASGEVTSSILDHLDGRWQASLGDGGEVIAKVRPPRPDEWARAIRDLHEVSKVARLERRGHRVDYATNAVWLAELHDPELPAWIAALGHSVDQGLTAGRELRLHMLLFLPDLFDLTPSERNQAQENLEWLQPVAETRLPMRVWPLSVRNRVDLYLGDALDLLPLVQLFIEVCLFRDFRFHPQALRGRDWGGVGCCQLLIGKPSPQNLAADLWREIKQVSVADLRPKPRARASASGNREEQVPGRLSIGGDGSTHGPAESGESALWDWARFVAWFQKLGGNPPDVVPEVPLCPSAPSCGFGTDAVPQCPQRQSCSRHPSWRLDEEWAAFTEKAKGRCAEEIAAKLEPLEQGLINDLVPSVARLGLGGWDELRKRLEKALGRANADLDAAVEPFDRVMGVKAARRWRAGGRSGALAGITPSGNDLEERLAQVDDALENCKLELFLQNDDEGRSVAYDLADIRGQFELNEKQWEDRFEKKDKADAGQDTAATVPWFRRAARWIVESVRRATARVWTSPAPAESGEDLLWKKRLCDRAWHLIDRGYELHLRKWELTREWLARWAEYRVRRVYRDALVRALERCNAALKAAEGIELSRGHRSRHSLVLHLDLPDKLVRARVNTLARELVRAGVLQSLLDQRPDDLTATLLREAERAIAEFPEPSLEELLDDRVWAAAFDIAAPRVMAAHRPNQERYTMVFCHSTPPRVPEQLITDRYWRNSEGVMLRFVYPIFPEDLLGDLAVPALAAGDGGRDEEHFSTESRAHDDRPNDPLEQAFYG